MKQVHFLRVREKMGPVFWARISHATHGNQVARFHAESEYLICLISCSVTIGCFNVQLLLQDMARDMAWNMCTSTGWDLGPTCSGPRFHRIEIKEKWHATRKQML